MSKEKEEIKEEATEEVTEDTTEEVVEEQEEAVDEKDKLIDELTETVAKLKNDFARAYADTENMKKRLTKEADNAKKYRFKDSALELLPIVDNMAMALSVKTENPEVLNYMKGFEMIYNQLVSVLDKEGVKEIEAEGKPFDHNTMQALMQEAVEGVESGMVVQVLQKGYMLKDRILRPALVKVSE